MDNTNLASQQYVSQPTCLPYNLENTSLYLNSTPYNRLVCRPNKKQKQKSYCISLRRLKHHLHTRTNPPPVPPSQAVVCLSLSLSLCLSLSVSRSLSLAPSLPPSIHRKHLQQADCSLNRTVPGEKQIMETSSLCQFFLQRHGSKGSSSGSISELRSGCRTSVTGRG